MGSLAGCVAKTAVAPFERARLLAQTGAVEGGFIHTVRAIYTSEGAAGLWRGNGANCYRVIPAKGILFAANDYYKGLFRVWMGQDSAVAPFLSGSVAGMTAAFLTYPLDVTRLRMSATGLQPTSAPVAEADGSPHRVRGARGARGAAAPSPPIQTRSFHRTMVNIWRTEGLRPFFRGMVPTVGGAIPYEGIKFGFFDGIQAMWVAQLRRRDDPEAEPPKLSLVGKLVCGAVAGIAAGGIMYPNDTVRRRMQVAGAMGGGAEDRVFTGPLDCARDTFARGGLRRFYRGVGPYLVRMVPNAAIQFAVYESLKGLVR